MKVLIIGATGMLGHMVKTYLKEKGYKVVTTGLKDQNTDYEYDANNNMEYIKTILEHENPNLIINCAGILNKVAEDNKTLAIRLNSLLPHYLDEISNDYNFKLIHISTDCVFDGKKGEYTEKDLRDAYSFYGRSKSLGEIENDKNLTLRTSIVGPDINENGIGLFNWFMKQTGTISGYSNVIWTGVTTLQLAKVIEKAYKDNLTGLYNVVNNKTISKYQLLNLFNEKFNKKLKINKNDNVISNKSLINTSEYDFEIPSYEEMVEEMKVWVDNHKKLYKNY